MSQIRNNLLKVTADWHELMIGAYRSALCFIHYPRQQMDPRFAADIPQPQSATI